MTTEMNFLHDTTSNTTYYLPESSSTLLTRTTRKWPKVTCKPNSHYFRLQKPAPEPPTIVCALNSNHCSDFQTPGCKKCDSGYILVYSPSRPAFCKKISMRDYLNHLFVLAMAALTIYIVQGLIRDLIFRKKRKKRRTRKSAKTGISEGREAKGKVKGRQSGGLGASSNPRTRQNIIIKQITPGGPNTPKTPYKQERLPSSPYLATEEAPLNFQAPQSPINHQKSSKSPELKFQFDLNSEDEEPDLDAEEHNLHSPKDPWTQIWHQNHQASGSKTLNNQSFTTVNNGDPFEKMKQEMFKSFEIDDRRREKYSYEAKVGSMTVLKGTEFLADLGDLSDQEEAKRASNPSGAKALTPVHSTFTFSGAEEPQGPFLMRSASSKPQLFKGLNKQRTAEFGGGGGGLMSPSPAGTAGGFKKSIFCAMNERRIRRMTEEEQRSADDGEGEEEAEEGGGFQD